MKEAERTGGRRNTTAPEMSTYETLFRALRLLSMPRRPNLVVDARLQFNFKECYSICAISL
jgi:hypothetical protein